MVKARGLGPRDCRFESGHPENNMKKEIVEGVVTEALPDTTFKVKLTTGEEILAYLSGKMRINYIKVVPGDEVIVELSPYDRTKGRIIKRK